jgi:cytochrome c biogenesis protein CcmG, thiol:disulfide interchange protein DsbE
VALKSKKMRGNLIDRMLLAGLGVLFVAFVWNIRHSFEQRVVDKGDSAPSFAITTDTGKRVTRDDFGGKLLVLNFWATWCPPCIEEMPSLNQFAQEASKEGIVVLGVSIDKNEQAYRRFLQQNRLSFETARDPEANIATDYGTFKWPETYVIDKKGKVVEKFIGPVEWTSGRVVETLRRHL